MTDIQLFFLWASCMMGLLVLYNIGNYISTRSQLNYFHFPKIGFIDGGLTKASLGGGND